MTPARQDARTRTSEEAWPGSVLRVSATPEVEERAPRTSLRPRARWPRRDGRSTDASRPAMRLSQRGPKVARLALHQRNGRQTSTESRTERSAPVVPPCASSADRAPCRPFSRTLPRSCPALPAALGADGRRRHLTAALRRWLASGVETTDRSIAVSIDVAHPRFARPGPKEVRLNAEPRLLARLVWGQVLGTGLRVLRETQGCSRAGSARQTKRLSCRENAGASALPPWLSRSANPPW